MPSPGCHFEPFGATLTGILSACHGDSLSAPKFNLNRIAAAFEIEFRRAIKAIASLYEVAVRVAKAAATGE
jgi:hypothetical protein